MKIIVLLYKTDEARLILYYTIWFQNRFLNVSSGPEEFFLSLLK